MPRFVILEHQVPEGSPLPDHWDLMVEENGELLTWALDDDPLSVAATAGVALPNHRLDFLEFEGPLTQDRGRVQRAHEGTCLWLELAPRSRTLLLETRHGDRWILDIQDALEPHDFSRRARRQSGPAAVRVDAEFLGGEQPPKSRFANKRRPLPRRGVIAVIPRDNQVLVIQRSLHVRAPGAYCFPGGSVEPGESDEQAVQRELREELGIAVQPRRVVWESRSPWGVELCWVLATAEPDANWTINPAEVQWAGWMTLDEMARLDPLLPSNRDFLRSSAAQSIV